MKSFWEVVVFSDETCLILRRAWRCDDRFVVNVYSFDGMVKKVSVFR